MVFNEMTHANASSVPCTVRPKRMQPSLAEGTLTLRPFASPFWGAHATLAVSVCLLCLQLCWLLGAAWLSRVPCRPEGCEMNDRPEPSNLRPASDRKGCVSTPGLSPLPSQVLPTSWSIKLQSPGWVTQCPPILSLCQACTPLPLRAPPKSTTCGHWSQGRLSGGPSQDRR